MSEIDCKTFEKQIDSFFDDDLDNDELEAFLEHAAECGECREELTIRLLIKVGLMRLEDGKNFHLGNEYNRMIKNASTRLQRRKKLTLAAWLCVSAVILEVVSVVVMASFILM